MKDDIFKDGSIYEVLSWVNQMGLGHMSFLMAIFMVTTKMVGSGHGTIKMNDNLGQYVGHWKSGKRDGFGTLILEDGTRLVELEG